ncbi:hypothetical protein WJX73_007593 [Symbiochloris irregularis]|uniref:Aminoglycoside phosphotransferase domain-containing protein n=1 Tax=Symbiochloris irregularis TaxID=706552 RepID=A0AAW1P7Q9_9CHLO
MPRIPLVLCHPCFGIFVDIAERSNSLILGSHGSRIKVQGSKVVMLDTAPLRPIPEDVAQTVLQLRQATLPIHGPDNTGTLKAKLAELLGATLRQMSALALSQRFVARRMGSLQPTPLRQEVQVFEGEPLPYSLQGMTVLQRLIWTGLVYLVLIDFVLAVVKLTEETQQLRPAFVHGDLCTRNVFARNDGTAWDVNFIDFDWAGEEGEATYTPELNHQHRRANAHLDGALIFF